ncbi:MAG: TetR/AcrR family transcriptional regulator [Chloroflexi bacterium]|nr:TetR/AcrR family transcriptional regulator [Chloroflexota bacterium]
MRKSIVADAQTKDEQIFTEAVRIFREKGYHAASMQNIADAVGLRKASLYHYISSKEQLLSKIFEQSTGALTQQLEIIIASSDSPTEKLRRAIQAHLTALTEQLDIYTVYLSERRELAARVNAKVRAQAEQHARLIEKILEQGIKTGDFRATDVKMAALAIIGMCNWLYQWYSPTGRLQPTEIANIFSDLIAHGLGPASKSRKG